MAPTKKKKPKTPKNEVSIRPRWNFDPVLNRKNKYLMEKIVESTPVKNENVSKKPFLRKKNKVVPKDKQIIEDEPVPVIEDPDPPEIKKIKKKKKHKRKKSRKSVNAHSIKDDSEKKMFVFNEDGVLEIDHDVNIEDLLNVPMAKPKKSEGSSGSSVPEDDESSIESVEVEHPWVDSTVSHVKINKILQDYRIKTRIWSHTSTRQDQQHTYYIYRYNVIPNEQPKFVTFISEFTRYWDWALVAMTVITFYILTYASIFAFFKEELFRTVFVMDIIFLLDTVMRVTLEVWRYKSQVPYIVLISPYTVYTWMADAISIFPLERILILIWGTEDISVLSTYDLLRYNRFLRFLRIFTFLDAAEKEKRISDRVHFFLKYSLIYVLFIQVVACIYFLLIDLSPIDIIMRKRPKTEGTWLADFDELVKPDIKTEELDYYALAIYFATSVVTTTGYGDMDAGNIVEMVISIAVMLIGAIILRGSFSSRLTNFELKLDGARFDLFFRVEAIREHLQSVKAAPLLCAQVNQYYPLLWNFRYGVQEVPFYAALPQSMQEDIRYDYCEAMFHKSSFLRGLDRSFLRAIASKADVILYNPEMLLCSAGETGSKMFYVLQGELIAKAKYKLVYNLPRNQIILRPGSLIGELNLMFGFPHTCSIQTRTACQIIKLEKEDVLQIMLKFPEVLQIARGRLQIRLKELHTYHKSVGKNPVVWIEAKPELGFMRGKRLPKNNIPVVLRRKEGINRQIFEDVVDDSKGGVIVDMPCLDDVYKKDYTGTFQSLLIPNILSNERRWVRIWAFFSMLISLVVGILEPYCFSFNVKSGISILVCNIIWFNFFAITMSIFYSLDLLIELTMVVPCSGLYYQLVDGFRVKRKDIRFWIDIYGIIALLVSNVFLTNVRWFQLAAVFGSCFRLWRVIRYLNYLDNADPLNLFFYRLMKVVLLLVYGVHVLACISFSNACPSKTRREPPVCLRISWLNSYENLDGSDEKLTHQYLAAEMPYLLSFYYSCATLSTAGFGDISPQTRNEMFIIVFFQLISFYILCYSAAILTSALSCVVRPRLVFENKMIAVKAFMQHYEINESLQSRVLEHYHLQIQLWRGVLLPKGTYHYMYDCPPYLKHDVLYMETEELFDSVPVLSKLEPRVVIHIAETLRRYLIPPGCIFLRKGEVRRHLYIIAKGSVGLFTDKMDVPKQILEASSYFGIRDLMFAEPSHYFVKTLSYCLIYEIELADLIYMISKEPELAQIIRDAKKQIQDQIDAMTLEYAMNRANVEEIARIPTAWIDLPTLERDVDNCTFDEYEDIFNNVRFGKYLKHIVMNRVVNPLGRFAQIWTIFVSINSLGLISTVVHECFMESREFKYKIVRFIVDMINCVDIYLKLHWGYFSENGLLVSHPVYTASHYILDGSFGYDILFCVPFEFIFSVIGVTQGFLSKTGGIHWFTKFRWFRLGQVIRIPAVIRIFHDIFKARSTVLLCMYVLMTVAVTTSLSAFASYLACPSGQTIWEEGDTPKAPFCRPNSWIKKKGSSGVNGRDERWITGIYYVSQVILLIGFGDMITLDESELLLLIFMMLFGSIILVCALSDITAAEVDLDDVRLDFLENMKRAELMMERERVHPSLRMNVVQHLIHTWRKSRALQPKILFADLHPALQADLYENFVGRQLHQVPLFKGLKENVMRKICECLTKYYFMKGERMARTKNMEHEMYIIVEGKVWIVDDRRRWCCTLESGESFGESDIVYGTKRTFNAFAATSVEVFSIPRSQYLELLLRYPAIEADFKRRIKNNGFRDLFEKKIRRNRPSKSKILEETRIVNDLLERKHVFDISLNKGQKHKKKKLFGYGKDDTELPFLYLVSKYDHTWQFLIHPNCKFHVVFMNLISGVCCLSAAIGVLEACFGSFAHANFVESYVLIVFSIILELLYVAKVIMGFFTTFEIKDENYCMDHKIIAMGYLMDPIKFPLDIISLIPFQFLVNYDDWTKWLTLFKITRLIHFFRFQFSKEDDIRRSTFRQKVSISVISFLLMAHFSACFFYSVSACFCAAEKGHKLSTCVKVSNMCPPRTWTTKFIQDYGIEYEILVHNFSGNFLEFEQAKKKITEPWRWYIRSLYWVVTTITTTGFGSIVPQNIPEILIGIFCIYCGSFALSVILSNFTSGISSLTQSYSEYFFQVDILTTFYNNIGISKSREKRINTYFVYYWERMRGIPYHITTSVFPITMKIDLCYALYGSVLEECPMFELMVDDVSFMRQLCVKVQHGYFLTGTNIVTAGDTGRTLYIVYRGNVTSWLIEDGKVKIDGAYVVGEPFGKHGVLLYDQFYSKNYRAETHVEALMLSQEDLVGLAKDFPEFERTFEVYTGNTLMLKQGQETIFDHERRMEENALFEELAQAEFHWDDDEDFEGEDSITAIHEHLDKKKHHDHESNSHHIEDKHHHKHS